MGLAAGAAQCYQLNFLSAATKSSYRLPNPPALTGTDWLEGGEEDYNWQLGGDLIKCWYWYGNPNRKGQTPI